jgi:hypothetical protein
VEDFLTILWLTVGLLGPVIGIAAGPAIWRSLAPSSRAMLATGALIIFLIGASPLSLSSVALNHLLLAAAFLVLCVLAVGGTCARACKGVFAVFAMPAVLIVAYIIFGGAAVWTRFSHVEPRQTDHLDCGYAIHFQPYGWVANSGVEAIVYRRLAGSHLHLERERRRFSDVRYDPDALSAATRVEDGTCYVIVKHHEAEIWSAR